jgi:serine/threonine protein kinase
VKTPKIGTPRYAAPELFQGQVFDDGHRLGYHYTEKSDVYSAAIIIDYLLTGWRPNTNAMSAAYEPPSAMPAQERWPELAALLERIWGFEQEARPSAGECVAELEHMTVPPPACG